MRESIKKALFKLLTSISKKVLEKYKPRIIGITGSYGKTSAREAIFAVLNTELEDTVRMTEGELNGEWGLHVAVMGASNPRGSFIRWLWIIVKGLVMLAFKVKYPDILLIEMAADKPGDISYMVSVAPPDIAVLTGIGPTHLEFFGSVENVAHEKFKLVPGTKKDGVVIYNSDDQRLKQYMAEQSVRSIRYGLMAGAHVSASQVRLEVNNTDTEMITADSPEHIGGIGFKVTTTSDMQQAYLVNMIGRAHILSALVAIAVGLEFQIPLERMIADLKNFKPAPGRMRLLRGIKNTFIIDDSYNSSPDAVDHALEVLGMLGCSGKKWAVLGEMLELGADTEKLHRQVGIRVAEYGIDYLITSGEPAHFIAHGARDAGMDADHVFEFGDKQAAGKFLQDRMKEGDLILCKASRGIRQETNGTRFEKIVKEIMAEPQRAEELLHITKERSI